MEELQHLITEYYSLIVKDHHKEDDCHFYLIEIEDLCGYEGSIDGVRYPRKTYKWEHNGYINRNKNSYVEFATKELAIEAMKAVIREYIQGERDAG